MAEQRLVRMQLDNIVRAKKLAKDMDAELLVISASDAAETDKAQAMDRVRAFYAQLHCLEFPTAPKARAEGATNCKQQLMDFLLAFLADSHNLSHNTTITASKFYEAYLLFEDAHKPPIRMSATMFGREIRTVHGVSKRRCTNGWVYTLDHTAMH
jgi:phage/plasmid-associated DNA primase